MSTCTGSRLVAVLATLLAFGTVVAPSVANAGSNQSLDNVLGEIEWGDAKSEVLDKLKSQMFEAMRNRADVQHNQVRLQEVRKRMVDKFEKIKESYTEFDGAKTGFEVSVIAGEYTNDNNEAVLTVEDDAAKRYYFFKDERFYKMVVAYRQSYLDGVDFGTFIGQVARKYGEPAETSRAEIGGEEKLAVATWRDARTMLRAKNKQEFYGTFAMVFSDRKRVEKMKANNKTFGGSDKDGTQVSKRIEGLKEDSGADANSDVVDGMIGEKVEVDISHKEEDLDKQGPTGEASKTEEETRDDGEASKQASSDEEQRDGREDREEERDFSNLSSSSDKEDESEGDDELIIY